MAYQDMKFFFSILYYVTIMYYYYFPVGIVNNCIILTVLRLKCAKNIT